MRAKKEYPKYLPDNFYQFPASAQTTMTSAALREILLNTMNGSIFSCGVMWQIKSKRLGAGVLKVWLQEDK